MSNLDPNFNIYGLHHVQLAMPEGGEQSAREFYCGALCFVEIPKPASLQGRGGVWLQSGRCVIHLGVEPEFRPARKAHPALLVRDLAALTGALERCGAQMNSDVPFEGMDRLHVYDPFGNRIELVQLHLSAKPDESHSLNAD